MKNDTVMHACLLGGALGDSIGLPFEGMGARRIAGLRKGRLAQSLVFGRGMVSDDTKHAVMTLLGMDAADGDVGRFARGLAGRLRWWLAGLPAGIGLKSPLGFPNFPLSLPRNILFLGIVQCHRFRRLFPPY